jgi:hypothetical protein
MFHALSTSFRPVNMVFCNSLKLLIHAVIHEVLHAVRLLVCNPLKSYSTRFPTRLLSPPPYYVFPPQAPAQSGCLRNEGVGSSDRAFVAVASQVVG